jgi:ABC-type Fe3+ transport system permease subunit
MNTMRTAIAVILCLLIAAQSAMATSVSPAPGFQSDESSPERTEEQKRLRRLLIIIAIVVGAVVVAPLVVGAAIYVIIN